MKFFKYFFLTFVLTMCFFSMFFITQTVYVRGEGVPYEHNFTQDLIEFNNDNLTNGWIYNLRNCESYTGIYNATFSFTNDNVSELPNEWVNQSNLDCHFEVKALEDDHEMVIDVRDDDAVGASKGFYYFPSGMVNGTVEFWLKTTDTSVNDGLWFELQYSASQGILTRFEAGNFQYKDLSNTWQTVFAYHLDTWYHFRFDFECSAGGYQGLSADRFFMYVNGTRYGEYEFRYARDTLDSVRFVTITSDSNYDFYIDGFGLNWLHYDYWENVVPITTINTTILEVDKDEWNFQGENDLYSVGSQTPLGWSTYYVPAGQAYGAVKLTYVNPSKQSWDRAYWLKVNGLAGHCIGGIKKNFDVDGNIIKLNITQATYNLEYEGSINWTIRDKTNVDVVTIKFNKTGAGTGIPTSIYYYDSSGNPNLLISNYDTSNYKNFALEINHGGSMGTLTFDNYRFGVPFINRGTTGLGDILLQAEVETANGKSEFYIDSVGVYNETSFATDHGFISPQMNMTKQFNLNSHYLYNVTGIGKFSMYACETNGLIYEPEYANDQEVREYQFYNGTLWDNICATGTNLLTSETLTNTSVILFLNGTALFNFSTIIIDGGHMETPEGNVYLNFLYSNSIHNNESYMWVGSDGYLHWVCKFSNDSFEAMRVFIQHENFATINRTIWVRGYQNVSTNLGTTFFLTYVGEDQDYWYLNPYPTVYHYQLRQTTTLDYYTLRVGGAYDLLDVEGYISSILFNYIPSYSEFTVTSVSLLMVLIPLVIILVPSWAIGEKMGKEGFILLLFILSVICVITQLIPIWLFFLIVISFAIFIVKEVVDSKSGSI